MPPYKTSKYNLYPTSPHSKEKEEEADVILSTGPVPTPSESVPASAAASVTINGFVCALAAAVAFFMMVM
jgi:hypothetical protein